MTKKVKREDWWFRDKIRKIVESNCVEVPYEGTEVNKTGIVDGIMDLLTTTKEYSLLSHKIKH